MGRSQVVRQRILIPPFPGSSPGAPASKFNSLGHEATRHINSGKHRVSRQSKLGVVFGARYDIEPRYAPTTTTDAIARCEVLCLDRGCGNGIARLATSRS